MTSFACAAALVAVAGAVSGCAAVNSHVALQAPAATAPRAEREAAYEALRPLGVAGVPDATAQLGFIATSPFPFLQLANGERVVVASDLNAVVDEGSHTALAARKAEDLRLVTNVLWTGGVLGIGAGAVAAATAPVVVSAAGDLNDAAGGLLLSVVGLGLVTGGTIAVVVATDFANGAEAEKMSAFLLYDGDLRRRLRLEPSTTLPARAPAEDPPAVVVPPTTLAPAPPVDPSGE